MQKKKIAIIGLGIAGLHLAHALSKDGSFDVTIFTNKTAEDIRHGRIPSTQVHFQRLLTRERQLDIPDYGAVNRLEKIEIRLNDAKLFKGNLTGEALTLDQRIYLSTLMENLAKLEVEMINRRLSNSDVYTLADEYDLIVDCSGKLGPVLDFPTYLGVSMPQKPLRICSAGFFVGLTPDEDNKLSFNILPGQGELFEMSTVTTKGIARSLLLEAIPGSDLDCIKTNDPKEFAKSMLHMLETFFPTIYARVDKSTFGLVDPNTFIRTAIKPELRIPYTMVKNTLVIGCGDSVVLNDPITGQGANTTSHCVEKLYTLLKDSLDDSRWDVELGEKYWQATKEYVVKATEWTNAMMGQLSPSFLQMLEEAAGNQAVADRFVDMFHNPMEAHSVFFSDSKVGTRS